MALVIARIGPSDALRGEQSSAKCNHTDFSIDEPRNERDVIGGGAA
jgi:hypothetical protein